MTYCAAVRRIADTFSSRPNISCQWPVAGCQFRRTESSPGAQPSHLPRRIVKSILAIVILDEAEPWSTWVTEVTSCPGALATDYWQLLLRSLLELVQKEVQDHAQHRVR